MYRSMTRGLEVTYSGQSSKAVGAPAFAAVMDEEEAEGASIVAVDPSVNNLRARRAYEKAGVSGQRNRRDHGRTRSTDDLQRLARQMPAKIRLARRSVSS
jgi:hypothetical protein